LGGRGDAASSFGRGADRHALEAAEVAPRRGPDVEQRAILGAHELEASLVTQVDPALDVVEPGRQLATSLAHATVYLGCGSRIEVLDHHVQHRARLYGLDRGRRQRQGAIHLWSGGSPTPTEPVPWSAFWRYG